MYVHVTQQCFVLVSGYIWFAMRWFNTHSVESTVNYDIKYVHTKTNQLLIQRADESYRMACTGRRAVSTFTHCVHWAYHRKLLYIRSKWNWKVADVQCISNLRPLNVSRKRYGLRMACSLKMLQISTRSMIHVIVRWPCYPFSPYQMCLQTGDYKILTMISNTEIVGKQSLKQNEVWIWSTLVAQFCNMVGDSQFYVS